MRETSARIYYILCLLVLATGLSAQFKKRVFFDESSQKKGSLTQREISSFLPFTMTWSPLQA
ncbi:MAG: hypothetical protein IPG79_21505 [Saprospiraceae bacterium]|nr:hypothetical protein [Saprospiraceae bacterium]